MKFTDLFKIVEVEINRGCNLSCSYCPNSITPPLPSTMEDKVFFALIGQLEKISYTGEIAFEFFNEPLLCDKLDFFISYCKKKLPGCYLYLYTNGTLLSESLFRHLLSAGLDYFFVTKHEGVENYLFTDVYQQLSPEEKLHVTFIDHTQLDKTNRGGTLEGVGNQELPPLLPCYIPNFITTVTIEGDVLYCFEDYHKLNIMGNIMDQAIDQIWFSPAYEKVRNNLKHCLRHLYPICKDCNRIALFPEKLLMRTGKKYESN